MFSPKCLTVWLQGLNSCQSYQRKTRRPELKDFTQKLQFTNGQKVPEIKEQKECNIVRFMPILCVLWSLLRNTATTLLSTEINTHYAANIALVQHRENKKIPIHVCIAHDWTYSWFKTLNFFGDYLKKQDFHVRNEWRVLTLPTYSGSIPVYSSSTKNWFQTQLRFCLCRASRECVGCLWGRSGVVSADQIIFWTARSQTAQHTRRPQTVI